jgi:hypothetical protein
MRVSVARVSQIEHGEVASFEVIARYVEAFGGRLDLVADLGDRTPALYLSATPRPPHDGSLLTNSNGNPGKLKMELDSLKKPQQPH